MVRLNDRYGNVLLYVLNSRGKSWSEGTSEGDIHSLGELNTHVFTARPSARSLSHEISRTSTRVLEDDRKEHTEVNLQNDVDDGVSPKLTFLLHWM